MKKSLYFKKSGRFRWMTEAKQSYYTFIPNSLSNGLEIEIDDELANILSVANRLLGQLEGMASLLPDIDAIELIFLRKEALLSCQIDEINAPFYDIVDTSKKEKRKNHDIDACISAMKYGLEKITEAHYNNTLLCDIHKGIMKSNCGEDIGQYRTKQIFLGNYVTNAEHYNPTAPDDISAAMSDVEKFINKTDNFDVLIKAALAHYQFETIHPFVSGNGRIGRIFSYLILSDKKILTRCIICLSHYLNINKVEYIDRMKSLQNLNCDYEQWIKFFVKAVIFTADDSLNKIKNWLYIREKNTKKLEDSDITVKSIKKIYDIVEMHPIIDVNTLAEKAGISYNTGASALKLLNKLGIMKQSNNMERNRDYAYVEFLNCFIGEDILPLSL